MIIFLIIKTSLLSNIVNRELKFQQMFILFRQKNSKK